MVEGRARSDVDIAVSLTPEELLREVRPGFDGADLHPVMVWPYDVGAASVFITTAAADNGMQLDLSYDTSGYGFYGLRADRVLAAAVPGDRWPTANPDHELLYLIRKRFGKGQHDRLDQLITRARTMDADQVRNTAAAIFEPWTAALVVSLIQATDPPSVWPRRARRARSQAMRYVQRGMRPTGFWVSVQGARAEEVARLIEHRFRRIVPLSRAAPIGRWSFARPLGLSTGRYRAAVLASWGPVPRWFTPDSSIVADEGHGPEEALRHVVAGMKRAVLS